jgi:hypothetical protein
VWGKKRVILIGYSFGTDVLPYVIENPSVESRRIVALAALLRPSEQAEFEFYIANWVKESEGRVSYPILPEIQKTRDVRFLCFYGSKETGSICEKIDQLRDRSVELQGDITTTATTPPSSTGFSRFSVRTLCGSLLKEQTHHAPFSKDIKSPFDFSMISPNEDTIAEISLSTGALFFRHLPCLGGDSPLVFK